MTNVVVLDISAMGDDYEVFLDEDHIIVEVLKTPTVTLVFCRDDLRRSQWAKLRKWADTKFGEPS